MRKHFKYLSYIIRHKFFVFIAGLKVGAPLHRLIIHDWSKFLPSEWLPYARYFYGDHEYYKWADEHGKYIGGFSGRGLQQVKDEFDIAWLMHIHRNKHHWQYFVLVEDSPSNPSGKPKVLEMPDVYLREMIADWLGAGRAITGKWGCSEWYQEHKEHIMLAPLTRKRVEIFLERSERFWK